ncbi:MAG: S24 family peptidase [Candidatus Methanoperedens sp.]|nr:S24 family peptidase [Candidatus Methanoperedens sp.]
MSSVDKQKMLKYSDSIPYWMALVGETVRETFAKKYLGVSGQLLWNYKNKEVSEGLPIPAGWLFKFQATSGLSLDVIMNPKQEAEKRGLISMEDHPEIFPQKEKERVLNVPTLKKEIPIADKENGGGIMADIPIPYGIATMKGIRRYRILLELLQRWVDETFPEHQRPGLIAWIVQSDNMEPTLPLHSMVLIDTQEKSVSESGIYAFQANGGSSLTFRRILPRLDGNVDVVNDNRTYGSYNAPSATVTGGASRLVGRVVFKGTKI